MFGRPRTKYPLTVFMDVDGVLNKQSDWMTQFSLNESCVEVFNRLWKELQKEYIPTLVLVSTWRAGKGRKHNSESYDMLSQTLKKCDIRINDTTPVTSKGRQNEINYYMRKNRVGTYIVIDDDVSMYDNPENINLYVPDYQTGLADDDIRKILKQIRTYK